MNTSCFISIIIPVYNVENYLNETLSSVQRQNFTNWECIIIDDGSTDNSLSIAKQWEEKDVRFKVVSQKNAGVSTARNRGIDLAKGDFIAFIDSDDYIESTYLEHFIYEIENPKTLVMQDITRQDGGKVFKNQLKFTSIKTFNLWDNAKDIFSNLHILEGFPCNKLFNRDIIIKNNIRFNPRITMKEDEAFCFEYYKYIDYIKITPYSNYFYIKRENSLTSKKLKFPSEKLFFLSVIEFYKYVESRVSQNSIMKKNMQFYSLNKKVGGGNL